MGFVYIRVKEIPDRNTAELFRNRTITIQPEDYGSLNEGDYFIEDLIGTQIFTQEGEYLSEVLDVEFYGATDILVVKEKISTYSVPFVKKVFLEVDLINKKIIADKFEYEENKV